MVKKASEGLQNLIDATGGPKVKGTVVVDQVYAQNQHETLYFKHPRGGMAKFLEKPLYAGIAYRMQDLAGDLLDTSRETWHWFHEDLVKPLIGDVRENAPLEFGDLKQSASATTKEGATVRAHEPAMQKRLSEAELDAKDYMRHAGQGDRS